MGDRPLLGKPIAEAMPELAGQAIFDLLDEVYRTGKTFRANEMPVQLDHDNEGAHTLDKRYYNFIYKARHSTAADVTGVFVFAHDVTAQVLAHRQVQDLKKALAASNEEMQATSEELGDTNRQLTRTNVDLDNFIYTTSHDLKQPIANSEGLLQALTYELPAEVRQTALVQPILERMHAAVEHFQKTIGYPTEVSKLQQAHSQPAQAVLLRQVIEEVALDLAPVLAAHSWLQVAVPPGQVITFSEKNCAR